MHGMQCNIDARGKRVRFVGGIVTVAIGLVLVFAWALPAQTLPAWAVTAGVILAGGFTIFEARAGWCALRAMGLKTPL
jgi:hypothetical protein